MLCSFQTSATAHRIVPLDTRAAAGLDMSPENPGTGKPELERHRAAKTKPCWKNSDTASRHAGQIVWALPIGNHQNGY
jgi:hypothetical protein